jgi:CRP-like cAMP-binding protein
MHARRFFKELQDSGRIARRPNLETAAVGPALPIEGRDPSVALVLLKGFSTGTMPRTRKGETMIGAATAELGTRAGWHLAEVRARGAAGLAKASNPAPQRNQLLAALPPDVQARLYPHQSRVSLRPGEILYACGAVQRHVYFPVDAVVALRCLNEDGSSAEVSVVGNEGLVGVPSFMGGHNSPWEVVVQCAGDAYRLPGDTLLAEVARNGEVLSLLLRYTQALIVQISQTAVCNRHHTIDQQLCWSLLRCLDRLPTAEIAMTQEVMASMLGVRREGVSVAAGKLRKLGLIRYSRGRIAVRNRRALEDLSCECYATVKAESDRLLPSPSAPPRHLVA